MDAWPVDLTLTKSAAGTLAWAQAHPPTTLAGGLGTGEPMGFLPLPKGRNLIQEKG